MEILFLISRVVFGGYWLFGAFNHFTQGKMMIPYTEAKGVPAPALAVYGTGVLIALGGLGILTGVWVEWAVLALVVFLIPTTLIMHPFWKVTDPMQRMTEMVLFSKNVALLGASLSYLFVPTPC